MHQPTDASPAYMSGFGNEFATEALPGALPAHRNSPQRVAYGLYAEQISGTAFTAPRSHNRRSWLYRIRPAAMHGQFEPMDSGRIAGRFDQVAPPPDQMRWDPLPMPACSRGVKAPCMAAGRIRYSHERRLWLRAAVKAVPEICSAYRP